MELDRAFGFTERGLDKRHIRSTSEEKSQTRHEPRLGLDRDGAFEPIGISCRICERTDCHQRSVPPLEKRLAIDPERREVLPYALE